MAVDARPSGKLEKIGGLIWRRKASGQHWEDYPLTNTSPGSGLQSLGRRLSSTNKGFSTSMFVSQSVDFFFRGRNTHGV